MTKMIQQKLDAEVVKAVEANSTDAAKLLIHMGADINAYGAYCVPLVLIAAKVGNRELVSELLDKGATLPMYTPSNETPLIFAIKQEQYVLADVLLDRGALADEPDVNGRTPLMYAVLRAPFQVLVCPGMTMIEKLLVAGADPDLQDGYGHSAIDYARTYVNDTIFALLNKHRRKK